MTSLCYLFKNCNCLAHSKENSEIHGKHKLVMKNQMKAKGKNNAKGHIITSLCFGVGKSVAKVLIFPKNIFEMFDAYLVVYYGQRDRFLIS